MNPVHATIMLHVKLSDGTYAGMSMDAGTVPAGSSLDLTGVDGKVQEVFPDAEAYALAAIVQCGASVSISMPIPPTLVANELRRGGCIP